ncbi:MAG: hypothetical protein ABI462_09530 [Ignavibacteria bacterium]
MDHKKKIFKPAYLVVLLLTMISYQIICERSIYPNVPFRMKIQDSILSNVMDPPYQYRIMEPVLGYSMQRVLSRFAHNPLKLHTFSYQIIMFFCLLGIYSQFYSFLKKFFSDQACVTGLLFLAVVIPLGISSFWQDGDYYTLFFYLVGLNLIFSNKDITCLL